MKSVVDLDNFSGSQVVIDSIARIHCLPTENERHDRRTMSYREAGAWPLVISWIFASGPWIPRYLNMRVSWLDAFSVRPVSGCRAKKVREEILVVLR